MTGKIHLLYGRDGLELNPSDIKASVTVIQSRGGPGKEISAEDLSRSFSDPIGTAPLRDIIRPGDSVCIVTSDGTRPFPPMRFMLHGILDHLGFVPQKTTVITGSGSHTPHTETELDALFCRRLRSQLKIVSHDSRSGDNIEVGRLADGCPVTMNRDYVGADRKIVLGHIEPHLFAGYTGGAKGIIPGICGIETIRRLHAYDVIADATSDYGPLEPNATTAMIREAAAMAPPDFLVNLILDREQKPVAVFSGDYIEAHRRGADLAGEWSGATVERRFPVVVTTNSGYPLDQNLYQSVKGLCVACRIAEPGGTIVLVSECSAGIPSGSRFEKMLVSDDSLETLTGRLSKEYSNADDRWQVQRLCSILTAYRVILVSSMDEAAVRACRMEYADTVETAIEKALANGDKEQSVAVLPDGPLTIPNKP